MFPCPLFWCFISRKGENELEFYFGDEEFQRKKKVVQRLIEHSFVWVICVLTLRLVDEHEAFLDLFVSLVFGFVFRLKAIQKNAMLCEACNRTENPQCLTK
jgi:hypothetical protein